MLVSDFSFNLPEELIARYPAAVRDGSRLMVMDRQKKSITKSCFNRIIDWLRPDDLLVLNNTRVIPARLFGRKPTGGRVEIFLVEQVQIAEDNGHTFFWHCLLRSSKRCQVGQRIDLPGGVNAEVIERIGDQDWLIHFNLVDDFENWLLQVGQMPIPPYLNRESEELDKVRYQTVYATEPGAVAAPTAGLHFTSELLGAIKNHGVKLTHITLHVGPGTFQPVRVERVQDHRIHSERYYIAEEARQAVAETRAQNGRVIAVGTTACRTLEYAASQNGKLTSGSGKANIFIYPGYCFKVVDALITNFHLPESTLLMLVSAFGGRDFILDAYQKAIEDRFRFYSYGDAMLIV